MTKTTKLSWALVALLALLSFYLWQKSGACSDKGDCCRKHVNVATQYDPAAPILKVNEPWCQLCSCGCWLCLEGCGGPGFGGCKVSQFRGRLARAFGFSSARSPSCPLLKKAK
jgi:hypothetical protein